MRMTAGGARIGIFTYSTQPRGSVVHASCLSEALRRRGHEVTLFALSKNGSRFFRDVACELRLIPAAEAPAELDALIAQRIAELVHGLEAAAPELDILHAQDCLVASALLEARRRQPRLARCPLLRTVHHVERFESQFLADCQRRSLLEADVLLSVSRATAEDIQQSFGRSSERVDNGVDLRRFDPDGKTPRPLVLAELGVPHDAFVALSVGGIEPRKNSRNQLAAVATASAASRALHWIIAGGASVLDHRSYQAAFDADLAARGESLGRRIIRTGSLDERRLSELYLASDVLLGASAHEGFGLSVLEGMAARRPVIVPNRPPFTEYVPERAALFVDPERPAEIAHALSVLEGDAALRARLGEAGAAVAREFSWERCAEQHARVYERALAHT
jgi:glycosyltransferase-like protein